ncbi:sulfurtransferase complex subunit TusB [Shewanella aegiceratis]|uniref:sulfurtransferase complex subunit TusB n=1 Tax=Shewanella aegiceratis TaxID=2864203 RepID=UPI001C65C431|nr:sulfurtransferase complex subunit TusB [Shewanella aegiceratis]QYJ80738.1 sulfurtransferase complex subunit TusB [Shewanella aegiceratis]
MILHIVQYSATQDNALATCLRYIQPQDTLLLLGDGVNALLLQKWQHALADTQICLLEQDLVARGLQSRLGQYKQLSQAEFVHYTLTHAKVITW